MSPSRGPASAGSEEWLTSTVSGAGSIEVSAESGGSFRTPYDSISTKEAIMKAMLCALAGALAAVLITTTSALAGSGVGGVFNLGQTNTVNGTSVLTGSSAGPQLKVHELDHRKPRRPRPVRGRSRRGRLRPAHLERRSRARHFAVTPPRPRQAPSPSTGCSARRLRRRTRPPCVARTRGRTQTGTASGARRPAPARVSTGQRGGTGLLGVLGVHTSGKRDRSRCSGRQASTAAGAYLCARAADARPLRGRSGRAARRDEGDEPTVSSACGARTRAAARACTERRRAGSASTGRVERDGCEWFELERDGCERVELERAWCERF